MLLCNVPLFFTVDEQYSFCGSCFRFIGDGVYQVMRVGEGGVEAVEEKYVLGWLVGWMVGWLVGWMKKK